LTGLAAAPPFLGNRLAVIFKEPFMRVALHFFLQANP